MSASELPSEDEILRFASSQFQTRTRDKVLTALGTPLHMMVMHYQQGEIFETEGFSRESVEAEHERIRLQYGKVLAGLVVVVVGVYTAHYLIGPSLITPRR